MRFSSVTIIAALALPIFAAKTVDVNWANGVPNPQDVNIMPGDTVRWPNNDGADHAIVQTVDAKSCVSKPGGFNSGRKTPGQAYQRTFPAAGTFFYKDGIGANCVTKKAFGSIVVSNTTTTGTATMTATGTAAPTGSPTNPPKSGADSLTTAVGHSAWIGILAVVGALVL
ncbi:hypothetical protein BGZ73_006124 [Actinomortierella ambigua]|nr:hypothetical protein BGZ73_006124 [Actinomortierella ambigua]